MNYAFYADATNITSCARPDLLDCARVDISDLTECQNEKYGEIASDLFDKTGTFTIDEDTWFIFVADGANVALDNIHVVVAPNVTDDDSNTTISDFVTDIGCNESLSGLIEHELTIWNGSTIDVAIFNFTHSAEHDVTFTNCGRLR